MKLPSTFKEFVEFVGLIPACIGLLCFLLIEERGMDRERLATKALVVVGVFCAVAVAHVESWTGEELIE